jgi:hypothetical protein
VIDISLSKIPVNFLPSLLVTLIAIELELQFFSVLPKLGVAVIVRFWRNVSVDELVLDTVTVFFVVVTVGLVTGFTGAGVGFFTGSGVGVIGTIFLHELFLLTIFLLMTLLVIVVGISQSYSMNAIGSTVLANRLSLQSHFSQTS